MSIILQDINGKSTNCCGFSGCNTDTIQLPQAEITIDEFLTFTSHILCGGLFGWGEDGIPDNILNFLRDIKKKVMEYQYKEINYSG